MSKRVVITGATGLIGKKIVAQLHKRNIDVIVFTRSPEKARKALPYAQEYVSWNAESVANQEQIDAISGAYSVINLAGENVGQGRWTHDRKRTIIDSRVNGTRGIVHAITQAETAPQSFINCSATGFYGNTGNADIVESNQRGDGFLADVCVAWEAEAMKAEDKTRVVLPRIGVVLDSNEGALAKMKLPYSLFVGGVLGSGKQYLPWIHKDDVARMILWSMDKESIKGAINVTAPSPVTMKEFAHTLGSVMKRPSLFPVPEFVLKLLLGEQHVIVTQGTKALPQKAREFGFEWSFASLDKAIRNLM
jgi:uncharacterized protein